MLRGVDAQQFPPVRVHFAGIYYTHIVQIVHFNMPHFVLNAPFPFLSDSPVIGPKTELF